MTILSNMTTVKNNPFKPGAGHMPPYLAGREEERVEFEALLKQDVILHNMILSGLRGIGKTVLLESFRPLAIKSGWLWAGTDFSESTSVSEETMALRILTDIALITSNVKIGESSRESMGFDSGELKDAIYLDFHFLTLYYRQSPGLVSDKLKNTLSLVWESIKPLNTNGIIFAYDEAQTLSDHAEDKQYPLSLLLEVFQSLQKQGVPFMLVLTGLPTLLVRLVEARTYSERLFRVLILDQLSELESRDAIIKPIESSGHPLGISDESVDLIIRQSGGYPYFIQFICREVFDIFEQQLSNNETIGVPIDAILQKLDNDFFAGRWAKATERERELLTLIALNDLVEFTIQQITQLTSTKPSIKPFKTKSQISQMLNRLIDNGLVYKNRRGTYAFAVPLLERYIIRTELAQR